LAFNKGCLESFLIPYSFPLRGQIPGGRRECTCRGRLEAKAGEDGELLLGYGRGEDSRQPTRSSLISFRVLITIIYLYISIMTDRAKHTPPPTPSTQPPWMMTPPRSAEKLMRALSIDPFTSNDARTTTTTTRNDNDDGPGYLTYLRRITSPSYRDPALPSGPRPDPEPLFIEDEEEDDIQMGTDNRMVSHSPAALTCRSYSNLKISLLLPVPS